jgi:multicomponent Na+:H+ antiporter subunit G
VNLLDLLSGALLIAGTVLLVAAAIGVVRFPDFYTRLHAAGKGDTMGQALVLMGLMLVAGASLVSLKLGLIVFFIFILNPTATHALAHGAWVCGVRPLVGDEKPVARQREGQVTDEERDALVVPLDRRPAPTRKERKEDEWTS